MRTKVVSGSWDSSQKKWTLAIKQDGKERSITSSFIVLAGGAGGQVPKMPEYPNRVSAFQAREQISTQKLGRINSKVLSSTPRSTKMLLNGQENAESWSAPLIPVTPQHLFP